MKINTAEKYLERFKARGAKRNKVRLSDRLGVLKHHGTAPADYKSKPNHAARFAKIADCFPLRQVGH